MDPTASPDPQVTASYDSALKTAIAAEADLIARHDFAVAQLASLPAAPDLPGSTDPNAQQRTMLTQQINTLETNLEKAREDQTTTLRARATALEKAAETANAKGTDPESRAAYSAKLNAQAAQDTALATKTAADLKEWQDAAPDRKNTIIQQQRQRDLANEAADLQNRFAAETDPTRKALLQQQLTDAQQKNQQAGINLKYLDRQQSAATATAEAGATRAGAEAATAQATADVAPQTAQTTLQQLQANVEARQLENQQLRNQLGAETDDQRKREIQQKIDASDLALQQAQSNLAVTQATLDKGKLGAMYGLSDRIAQIKQTFTRPDGTFDAEGADKAYQSEIRSATTGMTQAQLDSERQNWESENATIAANRSSAFTNTAREGLSIAQGVRPGSGVAGRGVLALLAAADQPFKDMMDARMKSPLAQSLNDQGAAPPNWASVGPATPARTTISPDGTVTIDHGQGGPSLLPDATPDQPIPPFLRGDQSTAPGARPDVNTGTGGQPPADQGPPGPPDPSLVDSWHQQNMDALTRYAQGDDNAFADTGIGAALQGATTVG